MIKPSQKKFQHIGKSVQTDHLGTGNWKIFWEQEFFPKPAYDYDNKFLVISRQPETNWLVGHHIRCKELETSKRNESEGRNNYINNNVWQHETQHQIPALQTTS